MVKKVLHGKKGRKGKRKKGLLAVIVTGILSSWAATLIVPLVATGMIVIGAAAVYQVINYTPEEVATDKYEVKPEDGCKCNCKWVEGGGPSTGSTGGIIGGNNSSPGYGGGLNQANSSEQIPGLSIGASNNAKEVYKILNELGYSDAAIYGILGNMQQESNINPEARGSYYGLVQISKSLEQDLNYWCTQNNFKSNTVEGQTRWLDYALTSGPEKSCFSAYVDSGFKISTDDFKKLSDSKLACEYFIGGFERCVRSGSAKPDDDVLSIKKGTYYQEAKKRKEYSLKMEEFFNKGATSGGTQSGENSGGTSGNIGSTGIIGGLSSDVLGRKIDGTIVPMYDGYTMSSSKYSYFDTDYSQFWNGNTPQSDPLYGLGDFSGDSTNMVSYEGQYNLAANAPDVEKREGYCLIDGRIAFAVPPAIATTGDILAEVQRQIKDTSLYKYPTYNNDPKVLNGNGNVPGYNGSTSIGLYFDIVLDDGTVVPAIVADTKAMHYGLYKSGGDGLWHDDIDSKGYCQMKWNNSNGSRGALKYKSMLEVVWGNSNDLFTKQVFGGKKIVSIRTYKIQHNSSNGYAKYFTEGGTDTSFATSGGVAGSNGSGGNGSGGNGHWECNCPTPCPDCHCHDGEGTGGEHGSVGGSTMVESEGTFQGADLFTDKDGKPYTSDGLWELVESRAPGGKALFSPYVGVDVNLQPIETYKFKEDNWMKYRDGRGALMWMQTSGGTPAGCKRFSDLPLKLDRGLTPNKDNNTMSLGCGYFATSGIMSTMLHRFITPAEVSVYASELYWNSGINTSPPDRNAMSDSASKYIFDRMKYKGKQLFNVKIAKFTQANVDSCLADGGMPMFVVKPPSPWTSGGHWIVIRQKNEDGTYLIMDGSHSVLSPGTGGSDTRVQFSQIVQVGDNRFFPFVTPGEGYKEYMEDMQKKDTSKPSGGTQTTDDKGFIMDWFDGTFNSAYNWKQTDTRWGADLMGESQSTMSASGCFVTSLAIQMAMSGAYEKGELASGFDPGTFNKFLGENGGYAKGTCDLISTGSWMDKVAPGFKQIARVENTNGTPICDAKSMESRKELIDGRMKQYRYPGYYIIFSIDYTGDNKADHFVALSGITAITKDFKVADPGTSSLFGTLSQNYAKNISCNIMSMRVYKYDK